MLDMRWPVLTITIKYEHDVVAARQRARQIAELVGFDDQDQSRIATAVSEIARNAFNYAGGGKVEFLVEGEKAPQALLVEIKDEGPGIMELDRILQGQYRSATGMGLGIIGARRLMDECQIETASGSGTIVRLKKVLSKRAPFVPPWRLGEIADQLLSARPKSPLEEAQQQNNELLRLLDELRLRQDELERLNRELEDTNRGVIALYAELDEQAARLRRSDELKSRFLSNLSHEFRTPLNSILALSQLLLDRTDGELEEEQEKQVGFIRKSAGGLLEMVNDLLDLAKIEAGKVEIQSTEFTVDNLFSALRGVFRPMLPAKAVDLIFEEKSDIPPLVTDEGKVTQILRNFISNALKYTERGEVRVRAAFDAGNHAVKFSVIDTGIGIAAADQERSFEEFAQIKNPLQHRVKGTGLGLPLCRKLATMLGGNVEVESALGEGSIFSASIPIYFSAGKTESKKIAGSDLLETPGAAGLLLIDDDESVRYVLKKLLEHSKWKVEEASNGEDGLRLAREVQPRIIVLDLKMPGLSGIETLIKLKNDPLTKTIPVIIITSQTLTKKERKRLMTRAIAVIPKEASWQGGLLEVIKQTIADPIAEGES
jgi:signal transduction histidine kinase/CheY-like chemotaxis protein